MHTPSQYVLAQIDMRGANKEPLEAAKKRFTENTGFRMSRVQFQSNAQQEYMHTPPKFIEQINGSTVDPLINATAEQIIQAQPGMTLSEIKELRQHQRFDVTALAVKR